MTAAIQQIDCETEAPLEMERVLRRFVPVVTDLAPLIARGDLSGAFVDCETTSLDPATGFIIELAVVPFTFVADGTVTGVGASLVQLEDPGIPIPAEITKITGITDAMVRRKRIADGDVNDLVANSAIVIAHNADFDRKFAEKRLPVFKALRWGCSNADVPWLDEGYESTKLRYLMLDHCRLFYDGHRADIDCYAGVHLLSTSLPSGARALHCVLGAARVSHARIYATDSPFQYKETLKENGYFAEYRSGKFFAWYKDVLVGEPFAAEKEFLANKAMCHSPTAVQFTSRTRFSDRIGKG